jgi:hypothetical protein
MVSANMQGWETFDLGVTRSGDRATTRSVSRRRLDPAHSLDHDQQHGGTNEK